MMRSSGKCWLWSAFVFTGLLATITDAVPISHPTDEVPISHPERGSSFPAQTAKQRAETARWMAHQNTWGYVTRLNPSGSSIQLMICCLHRQQVLLARGLYCATHVNLHVTRVLLGLIFCAQVRLTRRSPPRCTRSQTGLLAPRPGASGFTSWARRRLTHFPHP